jgi:monofunctional biosynthetic peptidoglycan transglycosylase
MKRLLGWAGQLALGFVGLSLLWVGIYRWVDPPFTVPMLRDRLDGIPVDHRSVALAAVSRQLPRAVIGAEDSGFCHHHGFEWGAIRKAFQRNERGGRLRGGSTISQQTAKNVFLWPGRTWLRKGLEAWFTVLIELLWGKARIMEVYLNVVELGRGIYGVEAAAQRHFGKPAARLGRAEAARLAAVLPQPITRDAAAPGRYTRRYAGRIERRVRVVARDGIDFCVWR